MCTSNIDSNGPSLPANPPVLSQLCFDLVGRGKKHSGNNTNDYMQRSVHLVRPFVNNFTNIFNKSHSKGKSWSALNAAFPIWMFKSVLQPFKTARFCRNCHRETDTELWLPSVKEKNVRNSITGKCGVISFPLEELIQALETS